MKTRTEAELRRWNEAQKQEALSDDNRWYAGEKFGHEPTEREAIWYYFLISDGPKDFAERHGLCL